MLEEALARFHAPDVPVSTYSAAAVLCLAGFLSKRCYFTRSNAEGEWLVAFLQFLCVFSHRVKVQSRQVLTLSQQPIIDKEANTAFR